MSTSSPPTAPVATSSSAPITMTKVAGPAGEAADEAAAERGRLEIAWSVVRKIAEHAADLSDGTTTVRSRLSGLGRGDAGSKAKVSGYGDQVDVRLEVPLVYPAPITLTVEAVRGNVRERVESLTGYRVRALDVTVSALADPTPAPARTGRVE